MWIHLENQQKINLLNQVSNRKGLPAFVVEKDSWVCWVLKAIFQSKYKDSIIFKGGTSLSKAYHLIERFSEDIDLIIDRKLLGYEELSSKSQLKKLRKSAGNFVINEFREELEKQLDTLGLKGLYHIDFDEHIDDTSDPKTLEIYYDSVIPSDNTYVKQRVLLELSARSMKEPSEKRKISSWVDEIYPNLPFSDEPIEVEVILPKRTFIEKMLLLHEEFRKPSDKIRTHRLTRHLYDIEKMMDTEHGKEALKDSSLFDEIVEHRKKITPLRDMDYSHHKKGFLQIIPPEWLLKDWEKDYKTMQEHMIAGDSLKWEELITRIKELQKRFNI